MKGRAQFSLTVPKLKSAIAADALFVALKKQHNATLIGHAQAGDTQQIQLNPSLDSLINSGDKLYYIAEKRINNVDWNNFNV